MASIRAIQANIKANIPLIVYNLAPSFALTRSATMLNACSIGCIWFLSPWMRRQGCRIAASSLFVSASRCESEMPTSWECHKDDRFLAYIHEHIPDLRQFVAFEWRVSGFIICNDLSDMNVRKTKHVFSGEACTSSAKSVEISWGVYQQMSTA